MQETPKVTQRLLIAELDTHALCILAVSWTSGTASRPWLSVFQGCGRAVAHLFPVFIGGGGHAGLRRGGFAAAGGEATRMALRRTRRRPLAQERLQRTRH